MRNRVSWEKMGVGERGGGEGEREGQESHPLRYVRVSHRNEISHVAFDSTSPSQYLKMVMSDRGPSVKIVPRTRSVLDAMVAYAQLGFPKGRRESGT